MNSVLLLSGGVESVTLLYTQYRHHPICAVSIDYAQRAAKEEQAAARWHCAQLGVKLQILDLAAVGTAFRAGQTLKLHVPLPHRNLVALSLGLSYATQIHAQRLYLALNQEDTSAYPSASHAFITQFQALARTLGEIDIATPFIGLSKTEIIQNGQTLKVDYTRTYSCLRGGPQHCGRCPQCQKRRAAFQAAGVAEPDDFYRKG